MRFLLAELDLAHERVEIGLGPLRPDWYAAIHPFGTVPALRDGDLLLVESNTMLRYLADRQGRDDLYPRAPRERARADQVMDALSLAVRPALWGLEEVTIYARTPSHLGGDDGAGADPGRVGPAAAALADALTGIEPLVTGLGAFGIADCALAGRMATIPRLPLDLSRWPALEARLRSAWARPAWSAATA